MGGDLEGPAIGLAPDGAEPLTLGPHRIGPALDEAFGLRRECIGGQINISAIGHIPAKKEVAYDTAYQIELVPRRGEPLSQWGRSFKHRKEAIGNHRAEATGTSPTGQTEFLCRGVTGLSVLGSPRNHATH
ncbi:unannotated protein [freshwater metagenome]|uniref:Unannotated protein n=1 Tax=freshwater metagenome TaxID=449393 RepID=A0A6J6G6T9_9ZZZZ